MFYVFVCGKFKSTVFLNGLGHPYANFRSWSFVHYGFCLRPTRVKIFCLSIIPIYMCIYKLLENLCNFFYDDHIFHSMLLLEETELRRVKINVHYPSPLLLRCRHILISYQLPGNIKTMWIYMKKWFFLFFFPFWKSASPEKVEN